ncbi:MAG: hypothetical protein JNG88_05340 [Phycisphaerales bacterium]|nr:hypothetical protein [Phycisphaerales bacterium]
MPARLPVATILALSALAACCGCDGQARVEYTSLDFANIDPPAVRVSRYDMPHCYWWTDARGQLWIAMERHDASLLGSAFSTEARLVFVLERAPAGRGRNYLVGKREMRGAATFGLVDIRYIAQQGIMGVNRDSSQSDELRGSFRIQTSLSVSQMFGGWGKPSSVLMFGEFTAVRDERRGREVVERAALEPWEEQSRPTATQPVASRPSSRPAISPAPDSR